MSDPPASNGVYVRWSDLRDHENRMLGHEERTDRIESVLDQLRGAQFMLKVIFGTSIVGALLAAVSLVVALR